MTLYGYDSNWTNVVQEVNGTNIFGEHLVNYNNNLYLVGDGLGKLIVITGTVGPEILSTTAFSYTDTNSLTGNAIVAESKIWFGVTSILDGNFKLYNWDGASVTLVNTFSDADNGASNSGRIVVGWTGSDIMVAYSMTSAGDGLKVRLRDGGSWTDTGYAAGLTSTYWPYHFYYYAGNWYVTTSFDTDTLGWQLCSSDVLVNGDGEFMNTACVYAVVSNPVVFSGSMFVVAEGDNIKDPGEVHPVLWKFNLTTGVRTEEADLGALFPAMTKGGQLIEYGTSLYLCIAESGGLYKSDGADTTTWSQVTS